MRKETIMLLKKFLSILIDAKSRNAPIAIVSHSAKDSVLYKQLVGLRSVTEFIDFGCEFGQNGRICRMYEKFEVEDKTCCCNLCGYQLGYLNMIPANRLKLYAQRFHETYGFWRSEKGCILDRQDRSRTCLTYNCRAIGNKTRKEDELGHAFQRGMYGIQGKMREIEEEIIKEFKVNPNEWRELK
jgi:hypothetical protein